MAQLDVYPNPDPRSVDDIPFFVDIQSDLLNALPTRAAVPLARYESLESLPILRLNPRITVGTTDCIALTQDVAAIPRRILREPIANLSSQREEILAALDFLVSGF